MATVDLCSGWSIDPLRTSLVIRLAPVFGKAKYVAVMGNADFNILDRKYRPATYELYWLRANFGLFCHFNLLQDEIALSTIWPGRTKAIRTKRS